MQASVEQHCFNVIDTAILLCAINACLRIFLILVKRELTLVHTRINVHVPMTMDHTRVQVYVLVRPS